MKFSIWWPAVAVVGLCLLGACFVNNLSALECSRSTGRCMFHRGSIVFSETEEFGVAEMTKATVERAGSEVLRAQGGLDSRVYVHTKMTNYRFFDNGLWSHAQREQVASQINAFIADSSQPTLYVAFDRRFALLAKAFVLGLVVGGTLLAIRYRHRDR